MSLGNRGSQCTYESNPGRNATFPLGLVYLARGVWRGCLGGRDQTKRVTSLYQCQFACSGGKGAGKTSQKEVPAKDSPIATNSALQCAKHIHKGHHNSTNPVGAGSVVGQVSESAKTPC